MINSCYQRIDLIMFYLMLKKLILFFSCANLLWLFLCHSLCRRSPYVRLENVQKDQVTETVLRQLKRSIYTNIPASYMDSVIDKVVPTIELDFEEEKDIYHVKVFSRFNLHCSHYLFDLWSAKSVWIILNNKEKTTKQKKG